MSYWSNLGAAVFNIGSGSVNSYISGINKKYEANQANRSFPYEEGFATVSDVYAVTNRLSKDAASVPNNLKLRKGDDIEDVTSGEAYDIVKNPNPKQTQQQFTNNSSLDLLLSGEVFYKPLVPIGFRAPSEVSLLHPQHIDIETMLDGMDMTAKKYTYYIGGKQFYLTPEEVYQLKYCNPTDYGIKSLRGFAPLVAGYLDMIGLKSNATASASITENQAVAGIITNESEYALTPDERDIQQDLFDKKYSQSSKFGKYIQSLTKSKFIKTGLDPTQLKIIESRVMKKREICSVYDTNSVLFNDPANRTQSNIIEATTQYWNTVVTNLKFLNDGFEKSVLDAFSKKEFGVKGMYFLEPDTSGITALQKDQLKEAQKDKQVVDGIGNILKMPITMEGKKKIITELYELPEDVVNSLVEQTSQNN